MNIGIDIGGSHIGVGLVGSSGKIINKKEVDITEQEKHRENDYKYNYKFY